MAGYGYDVYAVEFNPSDIELAKQLARERQIERLHIVEADYYDVHFDGAFDFVYYWDGFGVGEDGDQRRLLARIGNEWLCDSGVAVIDVFSPWNWQRRAGETSTFRANDGTEWTREIQFDALHSRFRDVSRPKKGSAPALSQTIRVYSMQDFLLLVEGTGIHVQEFYLDFDTPIAATDPNHGMSDQLMTSNGYYAKLSKSPEGADAESARGALSQ